MAADDGVVEAADTSGDVEAVMPDDAGADAGSDAAADWDEAAFADGGPYDGDAAPNDVAPGDVALDDVAPDESGEMAATAGLAEVDAAEEDVTEEAGYAAAAGDDAAADEALEPPEPLEPLDILVAEDNEVNCIVFSQILAGTPWNWAIARDGAEAVDAFKRRRPSLILMDVSMPVMNGLEATAAIRRIEAGTPDHPRTPIIGVTAHALKGDMERCLEAGMDDYLTKPVSPQGLETAIEKWLVTGKRRRRA
jgi:CheY-like chemotaxis protein